MIRMIFAIVAAVSVSTSARAAVEIQEVVSPGGITAWLVEEDSIPFTALEIRFRGGSSLDEAGKRGATYLMTALIEEGAGDLDARGFAEAREALSASYEFDVYQDALSISARFLSENRDEAIALLREALINPRFDQDAIDRVRAQVLSGIRSDQMDPNAIASSRFNELAFGDHPYGSAREGTEESVSALTRDDIVQANRNALALDRIYVGASGDITPEELGLLLDELLGDLPAQGAPQVGRAELSLEGGLTVIPFDTPQSVLFFGHSGIRQEDPEFFAAYLANEIFGGSGRQSRLMEEVREKRGLTYGVGTYLVSRDYSEMILGQGATANERAAEAIEVIKEEWAKISEQGVTEQELEEAKTYLTGAYPLRFDGNGPIATILVGMQLGGLPIDYIATRNDRVNAVTLEEVREVVKKIYRPEDLRFVVVGQPDGLDAQAN